MVDTRKDWSNIPASPACGQWETLLADALDGLLRTEDEATFSGHMATCAYCTEMFEQARRGREWLEFLAPEPEVPAQLLDRILVKTGHGKGNSGKLAAIGGPAGTLAAGNGLIITPAWQLPGVTARMRRFAEPRLLMTAAMAFFSIALTLSITGVRFSSIRMVDLRPATVRFFLEKHIMTASTPIVRYYDHLRFVYEVESRMRELRRSAEPEQQAPAPRGNKSQPEGESHRKDGGTSLNPNDAPQQTVNPPSAAWSGDAQEARLELPLSAPPTDPDRVREITGTRTHSEASGSTTDTLIETGVLAMPERSTSCLA